MYFELSAGANPSKIPEYIVAIVTEMQITHIATANHAAHRLGRSK
jgi:hypothetical protein